MKIIDVRHFKKKFSAALRDARNEIVIVIDDGKPAAMLIGFEQLGATTDIALVRKAIAVSLFNDQVISLSDAAKLASEPVGAMLTRLASLGVPVADYDESELANEVKLGAAWLAAGLEPVCHQPNQ